MGLTFAIALLVIVAIVMMVIAFSKLTRTEKRDTIGLVVALAALIAAVAVFVFPAPIIEPSTADITTPNVQL